MFHHLIVRAPFVLAWHKCARDRPSAVQLTIAASSRPNVLGRSLIDVRLKIANVMVVKRTH